MTASDRHGEQAEKLLAPRTIPANALLGPERPSLP